MYVDCVELENYRSFKRLTLTCADRLNVFVGKNGVGKSSLLSAIGTLLSCIPVKLKSPTSNAIGLSDASIRYGEAYTRMRIAAMLPEETENRPIAWSVVRSRRGVAKQGTSCFDDLNGYLRSVRDRAVVERTGSSVSYPSLPVVVYYATNRAVLDVPKKIRTHHTFRQLEVYDMAFEGGADFRRFFEWFRFREDLENEHYRRFNESEDRALAIVKKAMSAFLTGFTNWRIQRSPMAMLVDKHGETVRVEDLSDGEKCLLAMIGDMARRLTMANPEAENPLMGEGIVLIDEIELHLHPAWQKEFLSRLLGTFPNIQFFVTTHSPLALAQLNNIIFRHLRSSCGTEKPEQNAFRVWSVSGGQLTSLLDEETGLLIADEMDEVVHEIDEEFDGMLEEEYRQ